MQDFYTQFNLPNALGIALIAVGFAAICFVHDLGPWLAGTLAIIPYFGWWVLGMAGVLAVATAAVVAVCVVVFSGINLLGTNDWP